MKYFLSEDCALKLLESPCVYNIKKDILYELDDEAFEFLSKCSAPNGYSAAKTNFISYCLKEGILTEKPIKIRRPPISKAPVPSLRYLELQITDNCNLKCRHCYVKAGKNEISASLIKAIFEEFEAMQGLRVLITGGEPLMHSEFRIINRYLSEFSFRKILFTNGTLLTKDMLLGLNVEEIQVSIDGLEASHDFLRGENSYKRAISGIKAALSAGFEVSISTMVHNKNLNEFAEMLKMFSDFGIKDWVVDIPCGLGVKDIIPPPKTAGRYLAYGSGGGIHGDLQGRRFKGYGCGLHLMAVTARGICAKCAFYEDFPLGVISEGLTVCWSKNKPVRLKDLDCYREGCAFLNDCRGGCRYRAEGAKGKDLYRCAYYAKI